MRKRYIRNARELSVAIAAARKAAGLTQAELARLVGVSPWAVSKWELGERQPTGAAMRALSSLLGIDEGLGETVGPEEIGAAVRSCRAAAGLTQAQLSALAGVSKMGLSRIESGTAAPRQATLGAILSALVRSSESRRAAERVAGPLADIYFRSGGTLEDAA